MPLCRRLRHSLAIPDGAQVTSLATWNTNPANSAGQEIAARGSARLSAVACRCVSFRRGFRLSTVHSADTAVRRGAETDSAGASDKCQVVTSASHLEIATSVVDTPSLVEWGIHAGPPQEDATSGFAQVGVEHLREISAFGPGSRPNIRKERTRAEDGTRVCPEEVGFLTSESKPRNPVTSCS